MKTRTTVATISMLFLAATLLMVVSPLTTAHTEADPFVTDLIAGQTIDVGDVSVWNDGTHLYVKYATTGDWCLTGTHLHVATTLAEIPQTKKGNPIPGHFKYNMSHGPCTTEYTYAIDLDGWGPTTELYVAAHAGVCGPGEEPVFAQGLLSTVTLHAWTEAWDVGTVTAAVVGENLVVTFETTDGWLLLDTHLYVDATAPPTWPPAYADFPYKHEGLGEVTSDTYLVPLSSLGLECNGILYISAHTWMVRYMSWGPVYRQGWADENPVFPGGWLKYFTVTVPCKLVCETAWGDGLDFPGKNWAMYFMYTVQ